MHHARCEAIDLRGFIDDRLRVRVRHRQPHRTKEVGSEAHARASLVAGEDDRLLKCRVQGALDERRDGRGEALEHGLGRLESNVCELCACECVTLRAACAPAANLKPVALLLVELIQLESERRALTACGGKRRPCRWCDAHTGELRNRACKEARWLCRVGCCGRCEGCT